MNKKASKFAPEVRERAVPWLPRLWPTRDQRFSMSERLALRELPTPHSDRFTYPRYRLNLRGNFPLF